MIQWYVVNLAIKWVAAFGGYLDLENAHQIKRMTDDCLNFILKNQDKTPAEINEILTERVAK